jgi:hypothetical protein
MSVKLHKVPSTTAFEISTNIYTTGIILQTKRRLETIVIVLDGEHRRKFEFTNVVF